MNLAQLGQTSGGWPLVFAVGILDRLLAGSPLVFAYGQPGWRSEHSRRLSVGLLAQLLGELLLVLLRVAMSVSIASSAAASGSESRWT